MKNILIVCTGNICRSSMAEGMLKKFLIENNLIDFNVISAGTNVYYSEPATKEAIIAASEIGVDIKNHKSQPITEEIIKNSDLILTMTENHKDKIFRMFPEAKNKTFTLKEYVDNDLNDINVDDPWGYSLDIYKKCAKEIEDNLLKLIEKIKNEE